MTRASKRNHNRRVRRREAAQTVASLSDPAQRAAEEGAYDLAGLERFLLHALVPAPCDGTLRQSQRWATHHGHDWARTQLRLADYGGYCDCEVLLNVFGHDADAIAALIG